MIAIDQSIPVGTAVGARPVLIAEDRRGRLARASSWTAAYAITLLVHVGIYWSLTRDHAPDRPPALDQPAAVMIDMSPEVRQAFSQTDEAIGQPMQEAVATPPPPVDPTPDLAPPVEESPTPPIAPLPPKPPEKPKVEKKPPPPPKVPLKPSTKAAKRTASAPRSSSHAERTTAASAGAASAQELADWNSQVYAAINREKRFPYGASAGGSPTVRMQVTASGAVSSISIVVSSGSSELDEAAREAVERASPLPAPPSGARSLTFRMVFHRG